MQLTIRPETPADYRPAEALTREAFWNLYQPGCSEHHYLHQLRASPAYLPELAYVAELEGELVGHIAYSRTKIVRADGSEFPTITFGPVCAAPDHRAQGIGSALIRRSLRAAKDLGHRAAVILGDPRYYGRFGFHGCERFGLTLTDGKYLPGLMALELEPGALTGVSGRFLEGFDYVPAGEELAAFDAGFPAKEKGFTESQRDFQVIYNLGYQVIEHGFM